MRNPFNSYIFMVAVMLIVLSHLFGLVLGKVARDGVWERTVAKTECGQFNPDTGKFEWIRK